MKWSDAKRELKKLEKDEIVQLLKSLFELNPENKSFFELRLAQTGENSLAYYKREISVSINPSIDDPIDLKRGRNAISSFKKAAPDDLWGMADLMLYYVEQGAAFTLEFGDIDGRFYDSLMRMINSILDHSKKLNSIEHALLTKRFEELDALTKDKIGWGFSDHISDATMELQEMVHE